jgi:hypothetical protein
MVILQTGAVTERLRVREIDDDEGRRLVLTNSSWLNRVEAQFTALRYFALDGTDHPSHKEQASTIRRVHHLAQQPRLRRTTPPGRRPGKR